MKIKNKRKATITDIKKDISPFLKKTILQKKYVESKDVTCICRKIRTAYKNVDIAPKPGRDGYPYLTIYIKNFLLSTDLEYEIRINGQRNRTHDPLAWINRIEEYDSFMN